MTFNLSLRSLAALFGFVACRKEGMSVLTSRAIDSGIRSICHMIVTPACLRWIKARTANLKDAFASAL